MTVVVVVDYSDSRSTDTDIVVENWTLEESTDTVDKSCRPALDYCRHGLGSLDGNEKGFENQMDNSGGIALDKNYLLVNFENWESIRQEELNYLVGTRLSVVDGNLQDSAQMDCNQDGGKVDTCYTNGRVDC